MEDVELVPEKEKIEDGKEGCPAFHCDLSDTEKVHKIALLFVPGLASACVDNTTGGLFKSPASVAADLRKEMIDYLTQRSESFVAESVILEDGSNPEVSDDPYDIIADFVDDFASSKRNFFSRVSGWLLSEKREDNVDDFAQEMELNGFWLMDRKELIAQTLLKNVDFKNIFHCDKKFNTAEELADHVVNCEFRAVNCANEGCTFVICASHVEKHDSVCPFKIIPCEQKCSDNIARHEMDRHCITVCPMKLTNCPFYAVGCKFTIPRCMIQKHCSDDLQLHLVYALKNIHKGASEEDLKQRVDQIVQTSSGQLDATKDARSLTLRVRDLDAKLGPLEPNSAKKAVDESPRDENNIADKSAEAGAENKADEKSFVAGNGDKKAIEESTKDAVNITDKSIEAAAENRADEKSFLSGNDGKKAVEESTKDAISITDRSIGAEAETKADEKPLLSGNGGKKDIEESTKDQNNMTDKSPEARGQNLDNEKSFLSGNDGKKDVEESTEDGNNITDKSTEAVAENQADKKSLISGNDGKKDIEESTKDGNNITGKSPEARDQNLDNVKSFLSGNDGKKDVEESTKDGNNITDKSTEAVDENSADEKSLISGNDGKKDIEESTKDGNNFTNKSTEAGSENKADEKSFVAGNGGGEKLTNTTSNADEEESTGMRTVNLTTQVPN